MAGGPEQVLCYALRKGVPFLGGLLTRSPGENEKILITGSLALKSPSEDQSIGSLSDLASAGRDKTGRPTCGRPDPTRQAKRGTRTGV